METFGSPFFMRYLKALTYPLTQINGLLVGLLIVIGMMHNHAHHKMDTDTDGYVRQFCKKNPDTCMSFSNE